MSDNLLQGQVDQSQIDAWKTTYTAGIYQVESSGYVGYFKNPSRQEVNYALSKASDANPLNVVEAFANATFIGGSEEILKNDDLFLGACVVIRSKMNGVTAKLVNL